MARIGGATWSWLSDESGVSSIEYALIAASITIAVIVTVVYLGDQVLSLYLRVKSCIEKPSAC